MLEQMLERMQADRAALLAEIREREAELQRLRETAGALEKAIAFYQSSPQVQSRRNAPERAGPPPSAPGITTDVPAGDNIMVDAVSGREMTMEEILRSMGLGDR